MMTSDKQNKELITQHMQLTTNNNSGNITFSHSRNTKQNKFHSEKDLRSARTLIMTMTKMKFTLAETQPQLNRLTQTQNGATSTCVMEQKQDQKKQHQQQTMAQQDQNHTASRTIKDYFGFLNEFPVTDATAAANCTTKLAAATTAPVALTVANKRINRQKYPQQKQPKLVQSSPNNALLTINANNYQQQQQQPLKLQSTFANTTDPNGSLPSLQTTLSTSSSLLSTASSTLPPLRVMTSTTPTITASLPTTQFITAVSTEALTIPVAENFNENAQPSNITTTCITTTCSSKQECVQQQTQQQQQQKQPYKSANMSTSKNNDAIDNNRSISKANLNTCETDAADDVVATAATIRETATANFNTLATTNKANILQFNTNSINTTTTNAAASAPATTRPTEISTSSSSSTPSPSPTPPLPSSATLTRATHCKAVIFSRRFYQNAKQLECLIHAVVFSFVFVLSMQYQTVSASTSMMSKHEPMFISRSETFKFVAGDTIILPCEVANTDPYVVAWKRGIAILTAGSVKVTPDPRVRLVNGFNLQIRDAVPQDAGDYICQIATMEPREITHTVEILVPPRIHHISTSGHLQVKKGSSVRIECSASGNPTPNVTWSRKNNILPNGEEKLHSHILSIENVDRHKGGVYICTANNGVGQPASSQVVLHVLYPPEITVERPVVFSGEGHEAMLVCIVHGETQPEVIWFKDTMQLDTTERHIMENRGSRHTLIIRKVHPQDFGNYSCVAENQLGKSRKTLQLSGKPNVAVFNSPPISQYKDRYNISWTVESHTPIEEYKLSFRRLQQGQEVDNSIDSHSSSSSSMLQMYGGGSMNSGSIMSVNAHNYRLGGINSMNNMGVSGGYGSYGAGNVIHWGRNDWRDVVLPAIPTSHHYTQGMSYMIRGLDPDQHYEATVQARNRYGWGDYSQSFVFSTSSNDNEMRDLSVTFYGSKSSRLDSLGGLLLMATAAGLCVINFNY